MKFLNKHAAAFMIIALGISFGLYKQARKPTVLTVG